MQIEEHTDERGDYLVVAPKNDRLAYLIDAADRACLVHPWGIYWNTKGCCHYVAGSVGGHTAMLHRFLMGEPEGMTIDHHNGDKLLNRRYNLRICTEAENLRNRRPKRKSASGYRGVYPTKSGKYVVIVIRDRRMRGLGTFDDPIHAAKVRDAFVWEAFGEYANLNFPEDYP